MLSYQDTFERHVKTRLETSFGAAVAMLILATASNESGASMSALDQTSYMELCEAVGTDQRVVDMWGSSGAEEALRQWKAAGA